MKAVTTGKMAKANTTKTTLKRKVGYLDEGISVTRSRFSRMKIAEEKEGDTVNEGQTNLE